MSSHHPMNPPPPLASGALDELLLGFITEREAEYGRISRFLHDDVGQVLSAVGLQLDALRLDFRAQAPELEPRTIEIQEMLEPVIGRLRDISYELNPSVVQRAGLQFALGLLAVRLQKDGFSGAVRLRLDPAVRIPPHRAEALYRATEAATDLAVASPHCTDIDVQLKQSHNQFVLQICANAPIKMETASRLPALLMNYYATCNGIALTVNRSGERDTIIKFSCPISAIDSNASQRAVEPGRTADS
jgi:signal transduction histidine kinase